MFSYCAYNCFVYLYIPYKFYCKLSDFQKYLIKIISTLNKINEMKLLTNK